MKTNTGENINIWLFLAIVALVVTLAIFAVFSSSKNKFDADTLRAQVRHVAFTTDTNKPTLNERSQSSVVCPKDHTHSLPVCATCRRIMVPLNNGFFVCPQCGSIGLPICPKCGGLMHAPVDPLLTNSNIGGLSVP